MTSDVLGVFWTYLPILIRCFTSYVYLVKLDVAWPTHLPYMNAPLWYNIYMIWPKKWNCIIFSRSSPQYKKCEIITLPKKYNLKSYGFTLPKDSPYLPLFNYYIDQLRENGALERIFKKWEPLPPTCEDKTGQPLGFRNCLTCFLVMVAGAGLGIIILGIEVALRMIANSNKKMQIEINGAE